MCCLAQTPDVLSKAKELLEIVRNTVMIPKNLAGEWVCCVWVGLMCIVEFFHLSSVCCTCICTYNTLRIASTNFSEFSGNQQNR